MNQIGDPLLYSTIVGVRCKNGIVLGTEKIVVNKMMIPGTDKRIFSVHPTAGCVSTYFNSHALLKQVVNGLVPDGKSLMFRAREEATQYEKMFGIRIPGSALSERLGMKA